MQKEIEGNWLRKVAPLGYSLIATLLLSTAWVVIALTLKSLFSAVDLYGLSFTNILLDAEFGYLGLVSFGLASCALVLASTPSTKSKLRISIQLFRFTFFVGIFFFTPTIFSAVSYLGSK